MCTSCFRREVQDLMVGIEMGWFSSRALLSLMMSGDARAVPIADALHVERRLCSLPYDDCNARIVHALRAPRQLAPFPREVRWDKTSRM